jgi:hypothetical protein
MYKIQLSITNPMTGDSEILTYEFDPTTMTQAKWSGAWPAFQTSLNTLVTRSTPLEPPKW